MLGISQTTIELFLLNCLMAYSAYVVLTGGAFSFAYVAFIGTGAYIAGVGTVHHGFTFVESLVIAPVVCAIAAAIIAQPLERLSGVYLAIASVSLVGLFQVLLINLEGVTGGALGVVAIPLWTTDVILFVAVVIVAAAMWLIARSRLGSEIRAMRVDPIVAQSMGVNVPRLKLSLFVGSAFLAAIAGVLRAYYFGYVVPGDYGFNLVILLLAMVIIGGVGSWPGPLIGAAIFTLLPEWLEPLGEWRNLVTGALLLLIVIVSREGVLGALHQWFYRLRAGRPAAEEGT
jgi:branched-chain amino acid transport system permease protein